MENNIQKARDVLGKWRDDTYPGSWSWRVREDRQWNVLEAPEYDDPDPSIGLIGSDEASRLIVGTAGNPDLLDAIDGMLERAAGQYERGYQGGWNDEMARLAAAILAADERMSA